MLARELEVGLIDLAVVELHDQLAAGVSPTFVGLPDVGVLIRLRVVGESAHTGHHSLLHHVAWQAWVTGDNGWLWIVWCEDIEPLVAAETKLHRYGAAGLNRVHCR